MIVKVKIDIPDGFEDEAEYRNVKVGDYYLSNGSIVKAVSYINADRLILKKRKTFREPVIPQDIDKLCEFSDDQSMWSPGELVGYDSEVIGGPWASHGDNYWKYCRIETNV